MNPGNLPLPPCHQDLHTHLERKAKAVPSAGGAHPHHHFEDLQVLPEHWVEMCNRTMWMFARVPETEGK